jgi:predicted site-specific integrase-resolvase
VKTEIKKRAFGFSEFAQMFGISRDTTKRLWKNGQLATITINARRLIPMSEVERVEREGIGRPRKSKASNRK